MEMLLLFSNCDFWNRQHVLYILLNIKIDLSQTEGCFESCTVLKSLEGFGNADFVSYCGLHGTPVELSDCFCADKGTEINKASGDFKACFAHRTINLSNKFAYTSIVYRLSMQIFQEATEIEARAKCFRTAGK